MPPYRAACFVLDRNFFDGPQGMASHSPQSFQSLYSQSTGQSTPVSQLISSSGSPTQCRPCGPTASSATKRNLTRFPSPQLAEQAVHSFQSSQVQFTEQPPRTVQCETSVDSPMQSSPPCIASVLFLDLWRLPSPPQGCTHSVHAVQSFHSQSIGQGWSLHRWCCRVLPSQSAPPKAAVIASTRWRVGLPADTPSPQLLEQFVQTPQSPHTQSLGHGSLHSSLCLVGTAGSHGVPPFTSAFVSLVRLRLPMPQLIEHSDQSSQSMNSQSFVQASSLHFWRSRASPEQLVPSPSAICVT